jgi:GrpB-like predicted nucleotidyltransferase (UPF0157 family)
MIKIIPYQPAWRDDFLTIGRLLRDSLGKLALRIDHIGSTAVPGLAAKDIIDVQVTVARFERSVEQALKRAGFTHLENITQDHLPPGSAGGAAEWLKWLYRPPAGQRPANIHIRQAGKANQRYALLFRDYLRANPAAAQAYAQVKEALVKYHPNDMDAYYDVKDPVCDIIISGAEVWAGSIQWTAGPSDC